MDALGRITFDIAGLTEMQASKERHSKLKGDVLELHIGVAGGLVDGISNIANAKLSPKLSSTIAQYALEC